VRHSEDAITAALEHLDFVVQPLDESAAVSVDEIVQDVLPPVVKRFEKLVETSQATLSNTSDPGVDLRLGCGLVFLIS
jgi:hypothetical protein